MLESIPMPCTDDSAGARRCQWPSVTTADAALSAPLITSARVGSGDIGRVLAAVARAYNALYYPAVGVTPAAILDKDRTPHVAQARHLCAYLLMEDDGLTATAAAAALGRRDHSTILHSKGRIAAALPDDDRLRALLTRVREALSGRVDDERLQARCDERRRRGQVTASPRELAEYRYWRLRSLRTGSAW